MPEVFPDLSVGETSSDFGSFVYIWGFRTVGLFKVHLNHWVSCSCSVSLFLFCLYDSILYDIGVYGMW